jgi:hypothetical protein
MIMAATMPALAELAMIAFGTVVDIIGDVGGGRHSIWHTFCGTGSFSTSRVLTPGVALLLGAAPFVCGWKALRARSAKWSGGLSLLSRGVVGREKGECVQKATEADRARPR